jgi:hypothetical protein
MIFPFAKINRRKRPAKVQQTSLGAPFLNSKVDVVDDGRQIVSICSHHGQEHFEHLLVMEPQV